MLAWHGVDSASTSREDLWRMYRSGYSASGAAAFAVNLARQQVEMDACWRRKVTVPQEAQQDALMRSR
jgi:hypothetical protein